MGLEERWKGEEVGVERVTGEAGGLREEDRRGGGG